MIKKITIKLINILALSSILIASFLPLSQVQAASTGTLREYKNELAKVQSEKDENTLI